MRGRLVGPDCAAGAEFAAAAAGWLGARPLEDFGLRPEGRELAFAHHGDQVDGGKRAWPVGDHDGNAAAGAHRAQRLGQGMLALGVEVRVRLIQHDQEGIAVERAGKPDALALTGGQRGALRPELGLIALRQAHDHLVHAGGPGGGDDIGGVRRGVEARDILAHRALDQRDVLRQIADMAPDVARAPLAQVGVIQPDTAAQQGPDADDALGQRGLAAAARADQAERVSARQLERDIADQHRARCRARRR